MVYLKFDRVETMYPSLELIPALLVLLPASFRFVDLSLNEHINYRMFSNEPRQVVFNSGCSGQRRQGNVSESSSATFVGKTACDGLLLLTVYFGATAF